MKSRRAAREWALRLLYARHFTQLPVASIYEDLLGKAPLDPNLRFARRLAERTAEQEKLIDGYIGRKAEKWDLTRIAILDHIILRMAICEFLFFDDIPMKVSINEAIDLAKIYSTDQSGRFVNGILDAVCAELSAKTVVT
ncbi:MAG: transcription antitermination factor NusB [Calditrichaeota bacterium]|nr:transcription antitermination factor NusB [Calditrichota bacterium]